MERNLIYKCAHCKAEFDRPAVKDWQERIDGVHWCHMSEQICPECGDVDIIAIEVEE